MDDADRGSESQLQRPPADLQRILRVVDAAAHNRIDVHVELGALGEQLQLLIEYLQALLRDLVRHHVVDGYLQVVQPGVVEPLDALFYQQIAIGDHAGDGARRADAPDNVIQLRMQQRLAAADGDDGRPQFAQLVDALVHGLQRHRLRDVVILVAVAAAQVAAPHGDDVRHHRMVGRGQRAAYHQQLARAPLGDLELVLQRGKDLRHRYFYYNTNKTPRFSASGER